MTVDSLREEIETEFTWRRNEMRNFKNVLSLKPAFLNETIYRKSLVVMLYSHYEGFTKNSFLSYIKFINTLDLDRKSLKSKPALIASSMHEEFKNYENKDRKNPHVKKKASNDKSIHMISRRADLVLGFEDYLAKKLVLNDDIIDTESNLWSCVLEKNLYKLSIDHNSFISFHKDIDKLVNSRNSIAHGSEKRGITEKVYDGLETSIYKFMNRFIIILIKEANLILNLC